MSSRPCAAAGIETTAIMLIFGCFVLFLLPRTVVVKVMDTGNRREKEENRTEMVVPELDEVTTTGKTMTKLH